MSVSHADSDNLLERWVLFLLLQSYEWTMQNCNKITVFHNVKISTIPQVCRRGKPENAVSKYFCSICAQCVWLYFTLSFPGVFHGACLGSMELKEEFCPSLQPIMKSSFWGWKETQNGEMFCLDVNSGPHLLNLKCEGICFYQVPKIF